MDVFGVRIVFLLYQARAREAQGASNCCEINQLSADHTLLCQALETFVSHALPVIKSAGISKT